MKVIPSAIPEVLILEPRVYGDERGFFFESYNEKVLAEKAGITAHFVQDNHSRSAKNVLRGLHYQIKQPQGKLVRVVAGEVFDVAADIRKGSPTFGQWAGFNLSAENRRMAWIPPGFAQAFWSCPTTQSFSIRRPITGFLNTSAAFNGTTPILRWIGRIMASRCYLPRIGRVSHSAQPRCLSEKI